MIGDSVLKSVDTKQLQESTRLKVDKRYVEDVYESKNSLRNTFPRVLEEKRYGVVIVHAGNDEITDLSSKELSKNIQKREKKVLQTS